MIVIFLGLLSLRVLLAFQGLSLTLFELKWGRSIQLGPIQHPQYRILKDRRVVSAKQEYLLEEVQKHFQELQALSVQHLQVSVVYNSNKNRRSKSIHSFSTHHFPVWFKKKEFKSIDK